MARRFNDEVTRPMALEIDRKPHGDPDYVPWGLTHRAATHNRCYARCNAFRDSVLA